MYYDSTHYNNIVHLKIQVCVIQYSITVAKQRDNTDNKYENMDIGWLKIVESNHSTKEATRYVPNCLFSM